MPLIGSPGVAFIVVDDPPGTSANAVFNSVLSGWPVLVLTLLMALLSGIIMWGLVSSERVFLRVACARLSDSRDVARIKQSKRKYDASDLGKGLFYLSPSLARFLHHFLLHDCTSLSWRLEQALPADCTVSL